MKVNIVKAVVFPAVIYGFESWTMKKAEHERIDAFKLWWWRRFLSSLESKEIKPVSPKGKQTEYSLEGLMLKGMLKLWILWPLDMKSQLIGQDPDAEKDWVQEEKGMTGKDGCMASPTQMTWVWANPVRWWRTGKPGMQQSMGLQRVGHDWVTEHQHIVGMQKYLLTMAEVNIDKVINSPWRNWSPLKEEAIWKSHTDAAYHESFSSPSIFPVSTFPKRSLK